MPAPAGRSEPRRPGWSWCCWPLLATVLTGSPVRAAAPDEAPPEATAAASTVSYQQLPRLNRQVATTGRPSLLLLFGPDCRFCKQQARAMARLNARCPALTMALVGVPGELAALQQEVRQLQTPLPAFLADTAFLRAIDGVAAVPTSLLLDAEGRLLLKHRGMLDSQQLLLSQQLLAPQCTDRI